MWNFKIQCKYIELLIKSLLATTVVVSCKMQKIQVHLVAVMHFFNYNFQIFCICRRLYFQPNFHLNPKFCTWKKPTFIWICLLTQLHQLGYLSRNLNSDMYVPQETNIYFNLPFNPIRYVSKNPLNSRTNEYTYKGNVHKWCPILGGREAGGSSKIGRNRTR